MKAMGCIEQEYTTISSYTTAELVEKKSRFIGKIAPVKTKEEAEAFIQKIKKTYYDARHHVSAYIVRDERIERYSDDGEPQGTAGVPILELLKKEEITDICVVVIRYFGGTLLGTGGLVRAYTNATKLALLNAEKVTYQACKHLAFRFDYSLYGKIEHYLQKNDIFPAHSKFLEKIELICFIPKEQAQSMCSLLSDEVNGQIEIKDLGDVFAPISKRE